MKPLEGITVVELSTYIAAPGCGRILKTQGARVIKVESPHGDIERKFGATLKEPISDDENPNYDTLNGGKDHIVLDLKKPEDFARLKKLLSKADVFLTNNRAAALKKMGLDYDTLKEEFPQLVYSIILGYGEKGPKVDFPGFDAIAMFATGGMLRDLMVDEPGAYPVYIPMGFGDRHGPLQPLPHRQGRLRLHLPARRRHVALRCHVHRRSVRLPLAAQALRGRPDGRPLPHEGQPLAAARGQ